MSAPAGRIALDKKLDDADFALLRANPWRAAEADTGFRLSRKKVWKAFDPSIETFKSTVRTGPFSWIGHPQLPPVSQQLPFSTCVSHAGCRMLEAWAFRKSRKIRLDPECSHQCIYGFACKDPILGTASGLSIMTSEGVPHASGFIPEGPCPANTVLEKAPVALRLASQSQVKEYVRKQGPVVATLTVNRAFDMIRDFTPFKDDASQPGHYMKAVLIVGFEDLGGGLGNWIIQNSYGTGWGQDGFGRIAYGHAGILSDNRHPVLFFD